MVELDVDPASFREPPVSTIRPSRLSPALDLPLDRLHHLVWANNYDARERATSRSGGGRPRRRGSARPSSRPRAATPARSLLADGRPAWIDGGPRRSCPDLRRCWSSTPRRSRRPARPGLTSDAAPRRAGDRPRPRPAGRGAAPRRPGPRDRPGRVRARRGCSPSGSGTCSATAATTASACSPSPTTRRPSGSSRRGYAALPPADADPELSRLPDRRLPPRRPRPPLLEETGGAAA